MATASRPDESRDALSELTKRAQQGDPAAFEQLVRRFDPGLKRVLLRRTGGRAALADELAHDTWSAVWEALVARRYDSDKAAISTFIYAVAHKLWLQQLRRAGKAPPSQGAAAALLNTSGDAMNPAAALQAAEVLDALRACLQAPDTPFSLTEQERHIVASLAGDKTERALARRLGVAASTVHARKQSAYRKLRRCMAAKGFSAEIAERRSHRGE